MRAWIIGNSQRGGAKRIVRFWGGKRTIKCPLQTQFWRPQQAGFVWSVPASSKETDIPWTKGGEITSWVGGSKTVFGEGLHGMFSPPLSSPPLVLLGNKYLSNPRRFFGVYVFVLNSNSLAKNIFHVYVFASVTRCIPVKSAMYVYLIHNRWCSEFFTYVYVYWIRNSGSKRQECASFPAGMGYMSTKISIRAASCTLAIPEIPNRPILYMRQPLGFS